MTVKLLTFNVANPSPEKATRQIAWLGSRADDVLVLTEVGSGPGSLRLAQALRGAGYAVLWIRPPARERGVLLASRMVARDASPRLPYLPWRLQVVECGLPPLQIVGVYIPSRDDTYEKTERKRRFVDLLRSLCGKEEGVANRLLIGDFNLIDRLHYPRYTFFSEWEYSFFDYLASNGWVDAYRLRNPDAQDHSWIDRRGYGFRYDHAFVQESLVHSVARCEYVHESRQLALSDHAAMTLEIAAATSAPRLVVNTLGVEQPALF